jgi:GTP-binding protein LepA
MAAGMQRIRNFCIIAHIDHGKSTLADRILEFTGALDPRRMRDQVLDQMELERERGITIKASAICLNYRALDGQEYLLNLIDTPGHVDFSYEVSRSLAACEGAVLVVDAAQGVEAQTVANAILAMENNLAIIPVINKIDLKNARPEQTRQEIEELLALPGHEALLVSAKEGVGTQEVLEAIVARIPPPQGEPSAPLRALIFDSHFDPYRGVIAYVRVRDGTVKPGMRIQMMSTRHLAGTVEVEEVGTFSLGLQPTKELPAGTVGYIAASIRQVADSRVGDTITDARQPASEPLPGYRPVKPMVFCGLYPTGDDATPLREALEKLRLNDAALSFEAESSPLGFGFRCGFLGLLHMDIVQERLEREYGLELVATAPSVVYRVTPKRGASTGSASPPGGWKAPPRAESRDGEPMEIENPADLPPQGDIQQIEEPWVSATVLCPADYVGACMTLVRERRGEIKNMEYSSTQRVVITCHLPLAEILLEFFDQLKSRTRGFASFDYEPTGYRPSDLVKVTALVNGEPVEALSFVTHRDRAYGRGRQLVEKLRGLIPRQLFDVRIQAAIGNKIISSERLPALRKDVTAKCYGGDITRKRKLLERQKAGKKRMKQLGRVQIPQEAFLSVLKLE